MPAVVPDVADALAVEVIVVAVQDAAVLVAVAALAVEIHVAQVAEVALDVVDALLVTVHAQMAVPDVVGAALHAEAGALAVLPIVRAFAKTRALHRVVQLVTVRVRRRRLARLLIKI